jgi:hypothetical protein
MSITLPPGPLQDRLKVVAELMGPTSKVPLSDRVPAQPPLAEQLVALPAVQFKVTLPPWLTSLAELLNERVGWSTFTVRFTVSLPVPPGPLQLSV